MKTLHGFVSVVLMLLLVASSLLLINVAQSREAWADMAGLFLESRFEGACLGAALLCLAGLFALTAVPRRRERFLSFPSEGGTVSMSTQAICDYVSKLATEFPSIVRMRPRVAPAGKKVDVVIDVRIKAGPQIHEVCEVLQKRVRESLSSGLGIADVRRVEVSVKEISSEHKPA